MAKRNNQVQGVRSGELRSFERLFMELYPSMCSMADYYVRDEVQSKDIAQEAFVRLWDKRREFRTEVDVKKFLYTTIKNLSLNYRRDNRHVVLMAGLPEVEDEEFKAVLIEEEAVRELYAALGRLPQQSAKVMRLSLEGKKMQEIADGLGISVNSVKTLKYNAVEALKKELGRSAWIVWVLFEANF